MELMIGPFAFIEDDYRRERLAKDYARRGGSSQRGWGSRRRSPGLIRAAIRAYRKRGIDGRVDDPCTT